MADDILLILRKFWGHDRFRPLQEDIIRSAMQGNDTLALLPTGGGKSICYQVPALAMPGLCIVVSPLISLMKDQVERLRHMHIKAYALHAGLAKAEAGTIFELCVNPDEGVKFLYLSPERLEQDLTQERIYNMKVNLVAVDEAHCISQWGHDFRPSYSRIGEVRNILKNVPVMAVTATATARVCDDIQQKLHFKKEAKVFAGSYARPNLSLSAFCLDAKQEKLKEILDRVPGSSVVYVRSRMRAQETSEFLRKNKIDADFLHAGLSVQARAMKQERWLKGRLRTMVATTAFGMGIDKADVRTVIHLDMPENLESYYQEVGRAGRDGLRAYAVLLYTRAEGELLLKRIEESYPPPELLRRIYQALGNYLQVPEGAGFLSVHEFDLEKFQKNFSFPGRPLVGGLKRLEEAGYLILSDSFRSPSRVRIGMTSQDLYEYQVMHATLEPLIKTMLRIYGGGLFSEYVPVREDQVAYYLGTDGRQVAGQLQFLQKHGVLEYLPARDKPHITYLTERYAPADLPLAKFNFEERKQLDKERAQAMASFARQDKGCRMRFVSAYFGQEVERCGVCDNCLKENRRRQSGNLRLRVLEALVTPANPSELAQRLPEEDRKAVVNTARELLAENILEKLPDGRVHIRRR